jgi:hypothetical protein
MNTKSFTFVVGFMVLLAIVVGLSTNQVIVNAQSIEPTVTPTPNQEREYKQPFSLPTLSDVSPTSIITTTNPTDLAQAMGIRSSDIISASFNGSDLRGFGIAQSPLGNNFPTEGNTFAILSTGYASSAELPNNGDSLSAKLDGLNNQQGNDLTQLALRLYVPQNMNCASFDFAFFSEEFPEYVGSQYNDTFTAELGGTNLIISGTQVIAPLNFAYDTAGNIISINTVFSVTADTGTTYDGGTLLLRAQTGVNPGSTVDIVFSVQDLGDSVYDSAVFVDKFFWSNDSNCGGNAQEDRDGDGLLNVWETQGLTVTVGNDNIFVDLPAMGANPNRKDIFVEVDYMTDQGICIPFTEICFFGHSHKPKPEAIAKIIQAFANSPVPNPDGSTGINLHVDYGPESIMNPITSEQWGNRSQANSLTHDNDLGSKNQNGSYNWTEFDGIKNANFSKARAAVFHYVIFAHNLGGFGGTSGISRDIPASDFIVSLGSWTDGVGTTNEQAGTFMHELGHNLGLRHGGDDHANYEPNFLSIMNYSFQTRGLIINGQEGRFDYSRFALPNLDENNLDETVGLNGGTAVNNYGTRYYCSGGGDRIVNNANGQIDWNCNGDSSNTNVQTDINKDSNQAVLGSYNDWANIAFTGGAIGQPGAEPPLPMETEVQEPTQEDDAELTTLYKVSVTMLGNVAVLPGSTDVYTFTVTNLGINADTYTITVSSSLGWANISQVPESVTLTSGESTEIPIVINVPVTANVENVEETVLKANSQANPFIEDRATSITSIIRQIFLPLILRGN